jgi:hypothetical protein
MQSLDDTSRKKLLLYKGRAFYRKDIAALKFFFASVRPAGGRLLDYFTS